MTDPTVHRLTRRARSLPLAAACCALSLWPTPAARADDPPPPLVQAPVPPVAPLGDHWGVISATTDAPGHDVLSVELGFPGISFGYAHGISDTTDWGFKLDLNYGVLYTTNTQFGVAARIPLRMVLARSDKLSFLVHIDPGLFTYAGSDTRESLLGVIVPMGAAVGFQLQRDLRLSFTIDLPMAVQFLHQADYFIGPQFGFTVETYVDQHVSLGLESRFGPLFVPTSSSSNAQLGFVAQVVMGYRL